MLVGGDLLPAEASCSGEEADGGETAWREVSMYVVVEDGGDSVPAGALRIRMGGVWRMRCRGNYRR